MAAKYAISADQGATWAHAFTLDVDDVPVNLTGYTAALQLRTTVDATSPTLSLTSGAGTIVLGGALGTITLNVPPATTTALTPGTYVYDLEITSGGGVVTRLMQGTFTINAEVTR